MLKDTCEPVNQPLAGLDAPRTDETNYTNHREAHHAELRRESVHRELKGCPFIVDLERFRDVVSVNAQDRGAL